MTIGRARVRLVDDRRGGTNFLAVLIGVALIAFVVIAGARLFGDAADRQFEQEAQWLTDNRTRAHTPGEIPEVGTEAEPGGVHRQHGGGHAGVAGDVDVALAPPGPPVETTPTTPQPRGDVASRILARTIARTAGTATAADRELVIQDLSRLPAGALEILRDAHIPIVVVRGSVTEFLTHLRGVRPRGWPPGSTWDDVTGAYDPKVKAVVLAVRDGRMVRSGSINTVLHEAGHGIDAVVHGSRSAAFKAARAADAARLGAYESQAGDGGLSETYAESFARYYSRSPEDAKRLTVHRSEQYPNLHRYWESNPLGLHPKEGSPPVAPAPAPPPPVSAPRFDTEVDAARSAGAAILADPRSARYELSSTLYSDGTHFYYTPLEGGDDHDSVGTATAPPGYRVVGDIHNHPHDDRNRWDIQSYMDPDNWLNGDMISGYVLQRTSYVIRNADGRIVVWEPPTGPGHFERWSADERAREEARIRDLETGGPVILCKSCGGPGHRPPGWRRRRR